MNNDEAKKNDLVRRCKEGDREAFDQLVRQCQARIFNTAYRLLGDYEDARDATQDAFIRAYRAIKKFKGNASFYTWLYRIVINLCYKRLRSKHYRQRRRTVSLDEPILTKEGQVLRSIASHTISPREAMERKEIQEAIQSAINSLKRGHRTVIILRDIEDLSYREIAQILRCSIGTVKSRLHRARSLLRERLSFLQGHE